MINPASFKDPSGFVFEVDGQVYRQINKVYHADYTLLMDSGLYKTLTEKGWLLTHKESPDNITGDENAALTIIPTQVPFISYPYEWSFSQLQDAAMLTLNIMRESIAAGMILKDATPYNVQFLNGKPVFIDTASFEKHDETKPWVAYKQFCECFLFPLYLEHYKGEGFIKMLSVYLNGIPADFTAKLLPWKAKFNLGVRLHVLLQKNIQAERKSSEVRSIQFSKQKMLNLISHLSSIVSGLKNGYKALTTWNNYYDETILGQDYLNNKTELFLEFLQKIKFKTVADLGANDGYFSKLAAKHASWVVAGDSDSSCVNRLYEEIRMGKHGSITPIVVDLTNPSASIGFNNEERTALTERLKTDLVLALALIHHLCIAHNIPLHLLARYFSGLAPELIIEFVPKEDEKVRQLLQSRKDIFDKYNEGEFENSFKEYFLIREKAVIKGTQRTLYWMTRK